MRSSDTITRLPKQSTVARLGGDEFTVLLEDIQGVENAVTVAQRIQQELAVPFQFDGTEIYTSASIGIAVGPAVYHEPDEMLRDADAAMYTAKSAGKARCEVFDAAMRELALARLQLESDMRRGLERHEFCLHYQPILALDGDRLVGFEALVRWQHPERGLLSPTEFIPIAEETNLIGPLGWWVLEEACRQMKEWHNSFPCEPPLKISVNLSSKQFLQADLAAEIKRLLSQVGLDPHYLKLEITESAIMDDPDAASVMLADLRALGIQVCIDDFGTGYSSLNYLHRFAVDTLKIDQSFVQQMGNAEENMQIVQSIVGLAHNLSIDVIAEGVETEGQRRCLASLNCEYGQGYFFSRPMDKEAAEDLLAAKLPKDRRL